MVDNNAQAGTRDEVAKTPARVVEEPQQGYGHATRRGLLEAQGELIVLAEPDGTFLPEDLPKLLVYSNECDVVFGTRTTRELIWAGANMPSSLRWGNWAVAKMVEVLFNTSHLSDVGCTYRLLRRDMAEHVAAEMTVGGNHAGAEIMMLTVASGRALHRGAGELPPARGRLVGDRQAHGGHRGGPADDRLWFAQYRRRAPRWPVRPPGRAPVSTSHFDPIAAGLRRVATGPRGRALPRQAHGFVVERCPPGTGWTWAAAPGVWPRGWRPKGSR